MDPQVFGAFIQQRRKELGMNQSELAEKLHVTAKAVSRWERGVGFPDIKLLQPLADGLQITIVELMRSELIREDISKENAAQIVSDTVEKLQTQDVLSRKKKVKLALGTVIIILAQILIFYVYYSNDIEPKWVGFGVYLTAYLGGQFCVRGWYHLVTGIPIPEATFPKKNGKWWMLFAVVVMGLILLLVGATHERVGIFDQSVIFMAGLVLFAVGLIFMSMEEESK